MARIVTYLGLMCEMTEPSIVAWLLALHQIKKATQDTSKRFAVPFGSFPTMHHLRSRARDMDKLWDTPVCGSVRYKGCERLPENIPKAPNGVLSKQKLQPYILPDCVPQGGIDRLHHKIGEVLTADRM